ncbi:MAG: translocation/assembly module TamB domain-containing protein [Candidatus Aminicenantales bacterium]
MRIHPHIRIREHIQDLIRKVRRLAATLFVLFLLAGGVIAGKNIFLGQIRNELRKSIAYGELRVSYIPPAIILEDVRSLSGPPLFRARQVRIEISFLSLLRNEKSIGVIIDQPEIRLRAEPAGSPAKRPAPPVALPFVIERGIIENGLFSYETEGGTVEASGLKVLFTQRGGEFSLKATSEKVAFTSLPERIEFGGSLNVALSGTGQEIKIQRLTVEGPDLALKGDGRLKNIQDPEIDLDCRFEVDMAHAAALIHLPFSWKGKAGGQGKFLRKGGEVSLSSDIAADGLVISGVPAGRVRGRIDIDFGKGGRVGLDIQKTGLTPESMAIVFRGDQVEGQVRGAFLDPVMADLKIAWPVKSPAWGTFVVSKGKLEAEGEFRDQTLDREGNRFSLRGAVSVRFDPVTAILDITTRDIQTGFARLEAHSTVTLNGTMDTEIRGTVRDVKQAREFVSLILATELDFPEIRGAGYADVRLTGSSDNPVVSIKGSFEPAGFDVFDAAFVEGEGVIFNKEFQGKFRVDDPDFKGDIQVSAGPEKTDVEFRNTEGDVARVFSLLQIPIPLQGRAAGDFRLIQTATSQDVGGTFSSPEIKAFGQTFGKVAGRFDWKDGTLDFPEIGADIYGGRVQGRALVGLVSRAFDVDLRAENINIGLLIPDVKGLLALDVSGRGIFEKDRLTGHFTVQDLLVPPLRTTAAKGDFSLDYTGDRLSLELKSAVTPGDNEIQAVLATPVSGDALTGTLKGYLTNLDLLLPWTGPQGRLDFTAEISGTRSSPHFASTINFQGPLLPIPRFAHPITDYSGSIHFEDGRLTLTELKGKLGGGDLTGSGSIVLGKSGVETIDVAVNGKDMQLAPLERTRALVDGSVRLIKDSRQFVLDGDFLIKRLTWRRELYESTSFSSASLYEPNAAPSFFDDLTLNLRLRATDNALMDNSLGKVTGRFNLSLTGSAADPVLLGDMEILRGTFIFQDQNFRILKGRVSFVNPASTEPYLELRAETYVKDYRVTMTLSGYASRIKPEFTSSPPLPPEDVLALLALGEAFKNTYSYTPERSTTISTASLLSFQIADQAKRRAEGLFTLDRFRIDPLVSGTSSEMTARLTVGKKLSRNLLFIYSTNLATQRDEIYRMEWEVRSEFSLVAVRNELGRFSLDLKYRRRF